MTHVRKPRVFFVVSLATSIERILQALSQYGRMTNKELKQASEMRGGTWSATLADAKILGLIKTNGFVDITEEGVRFFLNDDFETRKSFYSKVTFFQMMLEKRITTYSEAKRFLLALMRDFYSGTSVNHNAELAARRYLEYVLGAKLSRRRKKRARKTKEKQKKLTSKNSIYIDIINNIFSENEQKELFNYLIRDEKSPIKKEKREEMFNKLCKRAEEAHLGR